jgi:arylsulfatase A-like enzyme
MPPATRVLVLCSLVAVASCGGTTPAPPIPAGLALRWIEQESPDLPTPDRLFQTEPVFSWDLSNPDETGQWRLRAAIAEPSRTGRFQLRPTGPGAAIERSTGLDAHRVDRIEVRLQGGGGSVTLSWAGPLQRFSDERSITADTRAGDAAPGRIARFDVASHPWWTGRIARLRLEPFGGDPASVGLISVGGLQRVADAGKLAAAVGRPWKVELASDARNALLALPGVPAERELVVPRRATLRFAYGLQTGVSVPIRFEVSVRVDGGEPRSIFADRLDPRLGEGRRWSEASLSLDELAGRQATVRLSTEASTGFDPVEGLPVWSNPEVVGGPPPELPNVVLVCLDTLRADRLSSYGHRLPTSPRIDRWADERAVRFQTTVATSPWTLPSHVSMFTGHDAARHGVNHYRAAPPSLEMVAERLRGAGYTTAAITGGGYLRPQFGFAQGFDRFVYWSDRDSERELATGMERALSWIESERARPFFLFFHTYEVHYPHRRRQPWFDRLAGPAAAALPAAAIQMEAHGWQGLVAPGDYFTVRRRGQRGWQSDLRDDELRQIGLMYDSAVAFADSEVGRLLDRLAALGLRGRTVVIVTSDHGEALGEDGRAGHAYLEDYNTLVPLIIELPDGRGAGTVIEDQVRLTDLAPTILDAAGLGSRLGDNGVSLLHLIDGEPSRVPGEAWTYAPSSNRGLALRLDGRLKYTYNDTAWEQIHGDEQLIDLEQDPAEHHDLAPNDPRAAALRSAASSTLVGQHRGARVAIRNAGPFLLKGRLRGALAAHDRVKAGDNRRSRVRWRHDEPPTFVVEPGGELILLLTSPDRKQAGINAHLVDSDGRRQAQIAQWVDLTELASPVAMEHGQGGWRRVADPSEPPATGFMLWWEGGLPDSQIDEPDTDAAALEQLRALGYVQ